MATKYPADTIGITRGQLATMRDNLKLYADTLLIDAQLLNRAEDCESVYVAQKSLRYIAERLAELAE